MTSLGGTIGDMPRKKKPDAEAQPPKPRPGYPVFARIDEEIGAALDLFLEAQRLRPTITTVIEEALKDFLRSEGFWPDAPPKKDGGK